MQVKTLFLTVSLALLGGCSSNYGEVSLADDSRFEKFAVIYYPVPQYVPEEGEVVNVQRTSPYQYEYTVVHDDGRRTVVLQNPTYEDAGGFILTCTNLRETVVLGYQETYVIYDSSNLKKPGSYWACDKI